MGHSRWEHMSPEGDGGKRLRAAQTLVGKFCPHAPEGFAVVDPETREVKGWAPSRADTCPTCLGEVLAAFEAEDECDRRITALEDRLDQLFREGPGPRLEEEL